MNKKKNNCLQWPSPHDEELTTITVQQGPQPCLLEYFHGGQKWNQPMYCQPTWRLALWIRSWGGENMSQWWTATLNGSDRNCHLNLNDVRGVCSLFWGICTDALKIKNSCLWCITYQLAIQWKLGLDTWNSWDKHNDLERSGSLVGWSSRLAWMDIVSAKRH